MWMMCCCCCRCCCRCRWLLLLLSLSLSWSWSWSWSWWWWWSSSSWLLLLFYSLFLYLLWFSTAPVLCVCRSCRAPTLSISSFSETISFKTHGKQYLLIKFLFPRFCRFPVRWKKQSVFETSFRLWYLHAIGANFKLISMGFGGEVSCYWCSPWRHGFYPQPYRFFDDFWDAKKQYTYIYIYMWIQFVWFICFFGTPVFIHSVSSAEKHMISWPGIGPHPWIWVNWASGMDTVLESSRTWNCKMNR